MYEYHKTQLKQEQQHPIKFMTNEEKAQLNQLSSYSRNGFPRFDWGVTDWSPSEYCSGPCDWIDTPFLWIDSWELGVAAWFTWSTLQWPSDRGEETRLRYGKCFPTADESPVGAGGFNLAPGDESCSNTLSGWASLNGRCRSSPTPGSSLW